MRLDRRDRVCTSSKMLLMLSMFLAAIALTLSDAGHKLLNKRT